MSSSQSKSLRVYCAGPLFNLAEQQEMTQISDALCDAGYTVYLPHRDGMEFRHILDVLEQRGWTRERAGAFLHAAIFALDVYQLAIECDCMVWNLNGRVPDEGAVSEAAIAWTMGKPLIGFSNDARSLIAGRINPLLIGLIEFEWVDSIDKIVGGLNIELSKTTVPAVETAQLPPRFQKAIEDGLALWQTMQDMGAQFDNVRIATVVEKLFAPEGT